MNHQSPARPFPELHIKTGWIRFGGGEPAERECFIPSCVCSTRAEVFCRGCNEIGLTIEGFRRRWTDRPLLPAEAGTRCIYWPPIGLSRGLDAPHVLLAPPPIGPEAAMRSMSCRPPIGLYAEAAMRSLSHWHLSGTENGKGVGKPTTLSPITATPLGNAFTELSPRIRMGTVRAQTNTLPSANRSAIRHERPCRMAGPGVMVAGERPASISWQFTIHTEYNKYNHDILLTVVSKISRR
jgi:hypothetical protein